MHPVKSQFIARKFITMPYSIVWLDEVVIVKLSGDVSLGDLHNLRNSVEAAPQIDSMRKRVVNCLEANAVEASPSDVKIFANVDGPSSDLHTDIDTAIVAIDPQIRKQASLYIEEVANFPWKTKLFYTLTDALSWWP
jgi:hypothetical protein